MARPVRRVLITGGAGFVGSRLALLFRRDGAQVTAFDNLKRRGSELNLEALRRAGARFVHGDVRVPEDLAALEGEFDAFIEASAEPSVHAGADGDAHYVVQTNLGGTVNCLELARRRAGHFLFLSTSRVYSIEPLRSLRLREAATRLVPAAKQPLPGAGPEGIAEEFPVLQARSLYGATKLASELLIQEYVRSYGLRATVDRCGVIAGPGQFGRTDQGVFTYWVAAHHFGRPLRYTGFGGKGKQVRDLLHPDDLYDLVRRQLSKPGPSGEVYNVGGGAGVSVSLLELTGLCRRAAGREVPVARQAATDPRDVPFYVSDCAKARRAFGWRPRIGVERIVDETARWIRGDEERLRPVLG